MHFLFLFWPFSLLATAHDHTEWEFPAVLYLKLAGSITIAKSLSHGGGIIMGRFLSTPLVLKLKVVDTSPWY